MLQASTYKRKNYNFNLQFAYSRETFDDSPWDLLRNIKITKNPQNYEYNDGKFRSVLSE